MKHFLVALAAAVYAIGAMQTYQTDRVMTKASCWKWSLNNSLSSSIGVAIAWPVYAVMVGTGAIMGMDVAVFACGNKSAQL